MSILETLLFTYANICKCHYWQKLLLCAVLCEVVMALCEREIVMNVFLCCAAGFTCRCEGLFCSVHRYSNEHRCTFDYREHGAEEIRRNNPVIKGEKIQKI